MSFPRVTGTVLGVSCGGLLFLVLGGDGGAVLFRLRGLNNNLLAEQLLAGERHGDEHALGRVELDVGDAAE